MTRLKQIYKITYPNGKIYVGSDVTADVIYIGSPSAVEQIAEDHGIEHSVFPRRLLARETVIEHADTCIRIGIPRLNLVLRKEILWESTRATDSAVRKLEMRFIRDTGANNPAIGYNKLPKYRPPVPILSA